MDLILKISNNFLLTLEKKTKTNIENLNLNLKDKCMLNVIRNSLLYTQSSP